MKIFLWFLKKFMTSMLPTMFGASLLAFFLVRWVPGDPILNLLGENHEKQKKKIYLEKGAEALSWFKN